MNENEAQKRCENCCWWDANEYYPSVSTAYGECTLFSKPDYELDEPQTAFVFARPKNEAHFFSLPIFSCSEFKPKDE